MKVAAYQAPLLRGGSLDALELIQKQVRRCESQGVEILCCPEAILGGLADYSSRPADFAIGLEADKLDALLAPLASDRVTSIVGFTRIESDHLYNCAAVFQNGRVAGLYRKLYPAIRKSVYKAGDRIPVFTAGALTFGILICNDSNFLEPARIMAAQGAAALFVPTNNALPQGRAAAELAADARSVDIARATDNCVSIIRADVSGTADGLESRGCSEIVDFEGKVLQSGTAFSEALLVADIETKQQRRVRMERLIDPGVSRRVSCRVNLLRRTFPDRGRPELGIFQPLGFLVSEHHAVDHGDVGQHGHHPQHRRHAVK